ncbi:MAG: hypothetical protein JWO83_3247 [Caulobacteraceae bacterium]|jgi:hypothetical protein|nr:hypothetical protein [Caulobacteraceae bacterium]
MTLFGPFIAPPTGEPNLGREGRISPGPRLPPTAAGLTARQATFNLW